MLRAIKIPLNPILFLVILACILFNTNGYAQFYNGTHTEFGKNRVQFDEFLWKYYRFDKYETYFYTGGEELAIFTSKMAQKHILDQELFFEYHLKDKIQFIIYNKQSHYKQSNVGLGVENGELAGLTHIMGSKVFIYFNGDHSDLERQIKKGIAQILINQQVYGVNWRRVLKNSSLLSLPEWYQKGLTSYVSSNWDPIIENNVRDGITTGRYKKFNRLTDKEAIIAGHSLWKYIVDTYGETVIPNILYMTSITQSIEKGFLYVLGVSMKRLTKDWLEYYRKEYGDLLVDKVKKYEGDEAFKVKKRRDYQQFKVSPDGNNYAYVTNQLGQYKLYIYSTLEDKHKKIYKKEFKLDRIIDNSYPILAFHPSGKILAFITEEKGLLFLHYYDLNTNKTRRKGLFNLEKVLDMDYSDKGTEIVFSAVYRGQSDLYLYSVGSNSQKNITNDLFDDLNPQFIENDEKIIFTSNRTNDSLGSQPSDLELFNNQKDIWIINHTAENKKLTRVTNSPNQSEIQPFGVDSIVYYLGEENNIYTRFSAVKDSFITHIDTIIHYNKFYDSKPITSYDRGLKEQNIDLKSGGYSEIIIDKGKYYLLKHELKNIIENKPSNPELPTINQEDRLNELKKQGVKPIMLKTVEIDRDTSEEYIININNYEFEKEKLGIQKEEATTVKNKIKYNKADTALKGFKLPNQRNYNLSFFNNNSAIKISNSFVNEQYQLFTGGPFINAGLGSTIKFSAMDLFEDYKVVGGFRFRFSGDVTEYFLTFQNLVKRLDKEYSFSRVATNRNIDFDFHFDELNRDTTIAAISLVTTNSLQYSIKYPLSEVLSIKASLTGRNDRVVAKSVDSLFLQKKPLNEYRMVSKVSLVFDNTRKKEMNIYYGTKFKIFGEYYQEVLNENKKKNKGNMQVLGMDFRHYQKISRELIWVNRFAASASFGSEKLIYYLGSVDDWIPFAKQTRFINENNIDTSVSYKYQALAANLRGFSQNIKRGSNFAVINSELRFPVFKYFIRKPIRSSFFRNFQVVAFADIGSAWNGINPYDDTNVFDKDVIKDGPITVTLFKDSDPIVAGYGYGFRTVMLGYFVRLDWAWGVEDWISKEKPMFYLSLSLDI